MKRGGKEALHCRWPRKFSNFRKEKMRGGGGGEGKEGLSSLFLWWTEKKRRNPRSSYLSRTGVGEGSRKGGKDVTVDPK